MFCYQCEQSKIGNCHSTMGVCGKDEYTAEMQDLLVYTSKGIAFFANELYKKGDFDKKYSLYIIEALFTTVTNVNFDSENIIEVIKKGEILLNELKSEYNAAGGNLENAPNHAKFEYSKITNIDAFTDTINIEARQNEVGKVLSGLEETILYGLKGACAYMDHAIVLGYENDDLYKHIVELLAFLTADHSAEELLGKALDCGKLNLGVMELLDSANTGSYGHPVPTAVPITHRKNKAILISGHDLKDLELLLKQTEGKGIDIYTHGEMLPAHGYPELKKYGHLYGNFGGAWQDQGREFNEFPGSILMTTNCIQKPRKSYEDRIFTTGLVEFPNVVHIDSKKDFTPVINKALEMEGFTDDQEEKTILTGFGHNAVLSVAPQVIEAVKSGAIKHFYLIGGCDGAKPGRNYYTELAEKAGKDSVILTLACGKFRFNKLDFGNIGGIPRLLDIGQCNDSYSAIKIAVALADAFETDVNSLPLSIILSWYEQKAVAVLLTLLHLGIKNIKIGPTLPHFLEPEAVQILVDTFGIAPISENPEDDLV